MTSGRTRTFIVMAAVVWLSAVGGGFWRLWAFAYTPGAAAHAPARWPSSSLVRDDAKPTLVMVLHPECGCSRASINELTRLVTVVRSHVRVFVLFDVSAQDEALTTSNDLWRAAGAIPGVTTLADAGGREARLFGARVSGQTFLYDAQGRLQFSGGLTASRGHEGDNDGEAAIAQFILTGTPLRATTPVFGCLLDQDPQS